MRVHLQLKRASQLPVITLSRSFSTNAQIKSLDPATQNIIQNNQLKSLLKPVIGLEVHAQIPSKSKLFSASSTNYNSKPNDNVSPLDASLPGTLPVINRKCVEIAIKTAIALHCDVASECSFDRKHYFYADMPQGYQITQYFKPIASNGWIEFIVYDMQNPAYLKKVNLKQIQLEQDSGKSLTNDRDGIVLIDLNRSGIGLMEFVFEPEVFTPVEASCLAKELHLLLQRIGSCSGKMEEGALRVDANVSVHQASKPLGVRTELKNLNSFKMIKKGVESEIERQKEVLSKGEKVINETRGFDMKTKKTISMRDKEVVQDYRFMPEPNLIPLRISANDKNADFCLTDFSIDSNLLPEENRKYLTNNCKLSLEYTHRIMFLPGAFDLFMRLNNGKRNTRFLASFLLTELYTFLKENKCKYTEIPVKELFLEEVIDMLEANEITEGIALDLLAIHKAGDTRNAQDIVQDNNWSKVTEMQIIYDLVKGALEVESAAAQNYRKKRKIGMLNPILLHIETKGRKCVSRKTAISIINDILLNKN